MDCYNKAYEQFGDALTGVEIITNNPSLQGCYAHTSPVIGGSNDNDYSCHVVKQRPKPPTKCPVLVEKKTQEGWLQRLGHFTL